MPKNLGMTPIDELRSFLSDLAKQSPRTVNLIAIHHSGGQSRIAVKTVKDVLNIAESKDGTDQI